MPIPVDTFWLFEIGNLISNTVLCEGMDWFGLFLSLQDFDPSPIQKILALSLCVSRIFQLSTWHFWNVPKTQHRTKMPSSAFRFLWKCGTSTTKWIQITAIVITTHQNLSYLIFRSILCICMWTFSRAYLHASSSSHHPAPHVPTVLRIFDVWDSSGCLTRSRCWFCTLW